MSLSSDRFDDPDGGLIDIADRKYRFRSNSKYKSSPLYRQGRDVELFAMLIHLKAAIEDGAKLEDDFLTELKRAKEGASAQESEHLGTRLLHFIARIRGVSYSDKKTRKRAEENGYLKARLLYLFAGLWGVSHKSEHGRKVLRDSGLNDLLCWGPEGTNENRFGELAEVLAAKRALIISSWLRGEGFRFPRFTSQPFLTPGDVGSVIPTIEPALSQKCFLESPWLDVSEGIADCTVKPAKRLGLRQQTSFGLEFVHLLLELPDDCKNVTEQEITACWLINCTSRQKKEYDQLILAAPTVCHVLNQDGKDRLSVRSNLLDLGGLVTAFTGVKAKIFLLCPKTK